MRNKPVRDRLIELSSLLRTRNFVDGEIAGLVGRPAQRSHIGEYIARVVFDIAEPDSAAQADNDGAFRTGILKGQTLNVKFYGKDAGVWSIKEYPSVDYYLVLTGAREGAGSSRGKTRPLVIDQVFIVPETTLREHGVRPGITTVKQTVRDPYRVYPTAGAQAVLSLDNRQRELIEFFDERIG